MNNKKFSNWNYTKDIESLAFFANIVDEMTFNYTIDSFKAPALNVISLMQETLSTLIEVGAGVVAEGALVSLLDEMKDAMSKDKAFNAVIKEKNLCYLIENIDFKQVQRKDTVNILRVLLDKFSMSCEYLSYLKRELSILIKETNKKEIIEEFSRSLITQLRNIGYSDEFLYFTNRDFFFGTCRIESSNAIDEYFRIFDSKDKSYEIYFIGNSLIENIENNSTYEVLNSIDNSKANNVIQRYKNRKSEKSKFLKLIVNAKDPYSARFRALDKIHQHFSLLNIYHHKYSVSINPHCLVYNRETNTAIVIKEPTKAIMKCKDHRIHKAIEKHCNSVKKLKFDRASNARFFNAIKLHDEALIATTLENQYINLFTAVEVLIPKEAYSNKDRILQIYDTLIPYLCVNYYYKLIDSILQSLLQWNYHVTINTLKMVSEGSSYTEKLVALIVLKKYDNEEGTAPLNILYTKLLEDKYLLMVNRMYKFHKILSNKKTIIEFLTRHEQRLKWHIDRIYRVRNAIVHAGKSPKYLSTLIENLHSYLDILLNQLIEDNINKGYDDINYSFTTCFYKYRNYVTKLSNSIQKKAEENELTSASEKILLQSIFN